MDEQDRFKKWPYVDAEPQRYEVHLLEHAEDLHMVAHGSNDLPLDVAERIFKGLRRLRESGSNPRLDRLGGFQESPRREQGDGEVHSLSALREAHEGGLSMVVVITQGERVPVDALMRANVVAVIGGRNLFSVIKNRYGKTGVIIGARDLSLLARKDMERVLAKT